MPHSAIRDTSLLQRPTTGQWAERETLEHSALNEASSPNSSPPGSGSHAEEAEGLQEPEGTDDRELLCRHSRTDTHDLTEPVAARTGPVQIQARWGPSDEGEVGLLPSKELSPFDNHLKGKR